MQYADIEQLIFIFSKLPGLGHRSARRIVLHLLQDKEVRMKTLISVLSEITENVSSCSVCGNIDIVKICKICTSDERDESVIAIVDTVAELWAIERSKIFNGKYHVLGATTSGLNNKSPTEFKLPELLKRCQLQNVQELIIATNSTLDGQTIAYFITEYFKEYNVKISRLAIGIPIGGELDYLDEGTLSAAINSRSIFQ